jgi:hypothetical protein
VGKQFQSIPWLVTGQLPGQFPHSQGNLLQDNQTSLALREHWHHPGYSP